MTETLDTEQKKPKQTNNKAQKTKQNGGLNFVMEILLQDIAIIELFPQS